MRYVIVKVGKYFAILTIKNIILKKAVFLKMFSIFFQCGLVYHRRQTKKAYPIKVSTNYIEFFVFWGKYMLHNIQN